MPNRIQQITELGQAIWLDFISRDLLRSGELDALIAEGLRGMTSNPSIFQKSIAAGHAYDEQIRELIAAGKSTAEIYEALAVEDIATAADALRPVYEQAKGRDGFVSIEVSPSLAHDTEGTIAEARRLHAAIGRPNVMIKVPGTEAGLPAITELIAGGINVNVTLIFAVPRYEQVMQAYLEGLARRRAAGEPLERIASVASFFVSRVDTLVDKQLDKLVEAGQRDAEHLKGKAAVANAKIAYQEYQRVFESPEFTTNLADHGAQVQRPLWASTSTKNPTYPDTLYVDTLIGPNTVNTVPPATLEAIRDHAAVQRTIDAQVEEATRTLDQLTAAGVDMAAVTDELLDQGVKLFADAFDKLLADLESKREQLAAQV